MLFKSSNSSKLLVEHVNQTKLSVVYLWMLLSRGKGEDKFAKWLQVKEHLYEAVEVAGVALIVQTSGESVRKGVGAPLILLPATSDTRLAV